MTDDLIDYLEEAAEWQKQQAIEWAVEELKDLLASSDATRSAKFINKLFAEKKLTDEDGNLIQVSHPKEIIDNIVVKGGGIFIALTEDQERWIRADKLYGRNVLGGLNIQYNSD